MKKIFRILTAIAVALPMLLLTPSGLAADAQAVRYYEDAVSRFNSGDLKGAEIQLKNSLQRNPSQLSARILMGRVLLGLGNVRQAEEELVIANQLGADSVLTALPLARARNRSGKQKENTENLVPTQYPIHQQPDIWVELGTARLLDSDSAGAKLAFEQALIIQPLHQGGTLGLVQIPLREGAFTEAESLAGAAVADFPESSQAFFLQASALHAQGKNIEAAKAYARARDLDPGNSIAGLGEAAALLDAKQTAKAAARLGALRESYPWMPEAPYLQSIALKKLGHNEEAKSALSAATDMLDPVEPTDLAHNPALLRLAGTIAYENGQLERAYKTFSLYLGVRQNDINARKMLARIALVMDKPAEAKRALVPIVNAGQADAETLGLLGDANAQLNDYIAAESYYRDAIANYRGGPALVGRLGAMQYRQGQREQALDTLQGLVGDDRAGSVTGISLYTAMLLFAEGQLDEARQIAERLVEKQPDNLLALNLQATLAIARGDNAGAHRMLDSLLAKDPTFRPARYNLAKLYVIEGKYRQADTILTRFLADNPNDVRTLQESGRLAVATKDRRLAIQHYEKIRQIDGKALIPIIELIDLYLAEPRPADAMNTALALNRALPNNYFAHETLARVQIARNEPEEAAATLKKVARLAGYDPKKLLHTAQLQNRAGAHDDAVWTLSKLLIERPNTIVARRMLAETLFRQGRLEEVKPELERILGKDGSDVYALALLGDLQLAQRQPQMAAETFARALQFDERPELLVSHYRARLLAGQAEAALTDLQAWQDTHPDNAIVLRALAERRHQFGDVNQALPLYERLIRLEQNDAMAYNNLANLLLEVDAERAFQAARRAYAISPRHPAILDTMGWSLVQLGDLDEGLKLLREAVARDGRSATMRYHLGVALEEYGSLVEARRELSKALSLASKFDGAVDARQRLARLQDQI